MGQVLSMPMFAGTDRDSGLATHLSHTRMGELETAVLITTCDPWNNRPLVPRSNDRSYKGLQLLIACGG